MTELYIVRHAQAEGNLNRTFQGSIEADITPLGYRQLAGLSAHFKSIPLDVIYVSPQVRARRTAEAVQAGRDIPLVVEPGIREINVGAWEGRPIAEVEKEFAADMKVWRETPWLFQTKGSEAMAEVYARVKNAYEKILHESAGKRVAMVSHGCAMRNLLAYLMKGDIKGLKEGVWLQNVSTTKVLVGDDMRPTVEYVNDYSYLSADMLG